MKFTLRELFLLTVIVALALGWWLDHSHLLQFKRKYRQAELEARNLLGFLNRKEEELQWEKTNPPMPLLDLPERP